MRFLAFCGTKPNAVAHMRKAKSVDLVFILKLLWIYFSECS